MKDTLEFGKRIKELRLKNDLSLRDLETKSGISFSFISSIEKGRFSPSRDTVIALAESLRGANKNDLLLLAGFAPESDFLLTNESTVNDADLKMLLGDRLKIERRKKKLRQEDVAVRIGIHRGTYANYEADKREPDNDTLQKLADFFEVSVDYLLGRTDETQTIIEKGPVPYDYAKDPRLSPETIKLVKEIEQLPVEKQLIIRDIIRAYNSDKKST